MDDVSSETKLIIFFTILFTFIGVMSFLGAWKYKIKCQDMESKRAIMFKLTDSDYVCEDLIKWVKENL